MGTVLSKKSDIVESDKNTTDDVIKKYVKDLIKEDVNHKVHIIPDFIKEKIYDDIYIMIIENLRKMLSDAKIELLDHEIRFTITPKPI